jgi:hypothetical protein
VGGSLGIWGGGGGQASVWVPGGAPAPARHPGPGAPARISAAGGVEGPGSCVRAMGALNQSGFGRHDWSVK